MVLRVWSLNGEGFKLRGEFGGALDGFPVLDALDVAFVCVLVGRADGDDPLGPGHLQLQVSVVGDCHEFGVSRASDDGMVNASKTHHLEK